MTHLDILTFVAVAEAAAICWILYDKPSGMDGWKTNNRIDRVVAGLAIKEAAAHDLDFSQEPDHKFLISATHVITKDLRIVEVTPFEMDEPLGFYQRSKDRICFASKDDPRRIIRQDDVALACQKRPVF